MKGPERGALSTHPRLAASPKGGGTAEIRRSHLKDRWSSSHASDHVSRQGEYQADRLHQAEEDVKLRNCCCSDGHVTRVHHLSTHRLYKRLLVVV